MKHNGLLIGMYFCAGMVSAKFADSVYLAPEGLARGGSFIDRFLPVPVDGSMSCGAAYVLAGFCETVVT